MISSIKQIRCCSYNRKRGSGAGAFDSGTFHLHQSYPPYEDAFSTTQRDLLLSNASKGKGLRAICAPVRAGEEDGDCGSNQYPPTRCVSLAGIVHDCDLGPVEDV